MDLVNYRAAVESLDTPEFTKSGYRVVLRKTETAISVVLNYQGEKVGSKPVSLTMVDPRGYTGRVPKPFDRMLRDVRDAAVEMYDNHNKTFGNADLLKALEDRLNGVAEMLVLVPGDGERDGLHWVEQKPKDLEAPVW